MEPSWRNMLCLEDVPWIRDHVLNQDNIFPGVAYIAMAGEAIRQETGTEDFSVRDMTVKAAMILHEPVTTETLFTLRPHRLTTSLDSAWYDFTVSSHNGTSWTKHCTGQVRAGKADSLSIPPEPQPQPTALPRKVSHKHWYEAMAKVGLNYGPAFQGLQDVSAHPTLHQAVARVVPLPPSPDDEPPHHFHPASMDAVFQLICTSAWRAQPRDVTQLIMPINFGEIYMRPPPLTSPDQDHTLHLTAHSTITARGGIHGDALATTPSGDIVLIANDMVCFVFLCFVCVYPFSSRRLGKGQKESSLPTPYSLIN
jgi:acyl transferase domain-containing protein